MPNNKKTNTTSQILKRFIQKEPDKQVFARIPKSVHDEFMKLVKSEDISIYQAVEISCKLFVDYCKFPEIRELYEKIKKDKS